MSKLTDEFIEMPLAGESITIQWTPRQLTVEVDRVGPPLFEELNPAPETATAIALVLMRLGATVNVELSGGRDG